MLEHISQFTHRKERFEMDTKHRYLNTYYLQAALLKRTHESPFPLFKFKDGQIKT